MTIKTPEEVTIALQKLDASDQVAVQTYIAKLKAAIADLEAHHRTEHHDLGLDETDEWTGTTTSTTTPPSSPPSLSSQHPPPPPPPPLYTPPANDPSLAATLKQEAATLKSTDLNGALSKYTAAILAAPPSALLYANRADTLRRLSRHQHAIRDCDEAIKLNPDSAKALRIRGRSLKFLERWEESRADLSAAQAIDFDDGAADDLKVVQEKVREIERERVEERLKEEEMLARKMEEVRRVKEEEEREERQKEAQRRQREAAAAAAAGGGMGGGIPGMGGMGGMASIMQTLMSDPELAAGLKNPKVMAAFADLMKSPGGAMGLMSNPAKLRELMSDPDVGPFMKKIVTKLGPMMMAGQAGGMGGMPGMGGMGGAAAATSQSSGGDDMPDIPDISKDDDMPNL